MNGEFFKKLRLMPEQQILVLNAPEGYSEAMQSGAAITPDNAPKKARSYDLVQLFAHNRLELDNFALIALRALKKDGIFWIAYPKKSSGESSDLSRDAGWDVVSKQGWEGVALISMDEKWSFMRFRESAKVSKSATKLPDRTRTGRMEKTKEIKTVRRGIQVPIDLREALEAQPDAQKIFDNLAYTHRKEYVNWIIDAKKPETRTRRLQKAVEMIGAGKKLS
jgi:hypothetical protein